jgi:hypothetical protein
MSSGIIGVEFYTIPLNFKESLLLGLAQGLCIEFRLGGGSPSIDPEVAMSPAIGIGFLSLTGSFIIAYIVFLIEQHKLQDELARHCREVGKAGKRETSLV